MLVERVNINVTISHALRLVKRKKWCVLIVMVVFPAYVLSAVTEIVTVVPTSELTDLAVVVISKSNAHVPSLSKVIAVGFEAPIDIVHAVCPWLWLDPLPTVQYLTVMLYVL